MMKCAFIENNSIEYKDLNKNEVNELCSIYLQFIISSSSS